MDLDTTSLAAGSGLLPPSLRQQLSFPWPAISLWGVRGLFTGLIANLRAWAEQHMGGPGSGLALWWTESLGELVHQIL